MIEYSLPPGPESTPEEQTFAWYSRPYSFLKECAEKYGDPFTLDFKGLGKHVFFSSPATIQNIFNGDPNQFFAGEGNAILKQYVGKNSLLTLDAAQHTQHRKLMAPAFHGQCIRHFLTLMAHSVNSSIRDWKVGDSLVIHQEMLNISLEIILNSVFGIENTTRIREMKEILIPLLDSAGFSVLTQAPDQSTPAQWNAWEKFQNRIKLLDKLIYDELEDREKNPELNSHSILPFLMKPQDGQSLNRTELRDEIMTLLLAGHETTATALAWAFYWIYSTPHVKEKLLAELNEVSNLQELDPIQKLSYLDATIKETLRIYPIIPVVSRRLQSPIELQGYFLETGVQVVPCIYLTHHREELYPKPTQFLPERFIERRYSPYEYFPFGGGVRRCIGMAFGITEMKIVLASLLKSYSFELTEKQPVRPVRRTVSIAPSGGVKMHITGKY